MKNMRFKTPTHCVFLLVRPEFIGQMRLIERYNHLSKPSDVPTVLQRGKGCGTKRGRAGGNPSPWLFVDLLKREEINLR